MSITVRESQCVQCPAGEATHGLLSLNDLDVECRIAGRLQPAQGSPCVDGMGYPKCAIWRTNRDLERMHKAENPSLRRRATHVLDLQR